MAPTLKGGDDRGIYCDSCLICTVRGTVWKTRNPSNPQQPHYYCTICHDRIVNATPVLVED